MERVFEELQLIDCSLLPGEVFVFLEHCDGWTDALKLYSTVGYDDSVEKLRLPSPSFQIGLEDFNVWFETSLPSGMSTISVAVKGEDISRAQQERWQDIVREKLEEIGDSEYPMYQLLSLHLLPMLHAEAEVRTTDEARNLEAASANATSGSSSNLISSDITYHALFTSHHLISPNKRRNLQQWSSSLSTSGFAKVGYPGVIYVEGAQDNVQEFVDNVKAMQWLALRLRFMEPAPGGSGCASVPRRQWKELQKVGEVTEEMREIGREKYVLEMGIGSAGTSKG
ncbi:hypothetical protein BT96DRAFT_876631 [Gymnopus androsaceus JB14]|uniref:Small nuclear ribonucleoprotein Prp3 C-terminal domain-containing protein n=1 Tax=Gymnopus androsaceus JB14 TaxID=1447944 RepID=A0A6A4I501_9AGAR|nr:hypothetical protein BT96DRAFT_876631 [Gymnopus androsaceus JB14]